MRRPLAALAVAGLSLGGQAAAAADRAIDFGIPVQPRQEALMALARQAGLSIGFAPGARCAGQAGFRGRASVGQALERLLAGSGCEASRPDARTLVIRARRAPTEPPGPPGPTTGPPTQLSEIVVTAEKRETLLSSSASGLTAVSGSELDHAGVQDSQDLSLLAAGVTVTNLGPGRDKILLRGLSDGPLTGHTQSTVGIYLGELRLTYNAPNPDLPLVDISRVEVLRGPQGSLYGAGSIGGILHIVPNAPDPRGRAAVVTLGAATTTHGAASGSAQLVVNQPLSSDGAVRAAAWSDITGGYIDDTVRGRSNIDRSRRRGVRVAGAWSPSDAFALEATVVDQTISTRDAHYATPSIGSLSRAATRAEPHDNDFLALSITAHWNPGWAQLTATLGALDHDVNTTYDATAAPLSLVPTGQQPATFKDGNEIRGVVSEARLASTGASRLQWVLGAFTALGRQMLDADVATVGGGQGYDERRRDRLAEAALFGEAGYDFTPELTLTLGGRLFTSRLKTASRVTLGATQRSFDGQVDDSGFAPKARLAWRPRNGLTLYALAAKGYRTPGFNTGGPPGQAFGPANGSQPLRQYGGDELWSYEVGGRWRTADGRFSLRLAAFDAEWRDIQADLILPSGLPFTANLGDGRSRGVEAEASYVRGGFAFSGNVVSQDPELIRLTAGLGDRKEAGLPGVAKTAFAARAAYGWRAIGGWDADVSASYAHVGESRLTFDAGQAPRMGGYGELRLAASLSRGDTTLALTLENAFDSRGDTLSFGNPFTFRIQRESTPQRPRTASLRVVRRY